MRKTYQLTEEDIKLAIAFWLMESENADNVLTKDVTLNISVFLLIVGLKPEITAYVEEAKLDPRDR